jgi:uncharacterized protein YjbK
VSNGVEVEFKFRLDHPKQFEDLTAVARGRPGASVRQRNHFFDTVDGRLNSARYALRLREEGDRFLLTAKGPERRSADGTLSEKAEEEGFIGPGEAKRILDGQISPLDLLERLAGVQVELLRSMRDVIADKPLKYVGSFTNTRRLVEVAIRLDAREQRVIFEMDRTEFPGRIDYEVEIDITSIAEEDRKAAIAVISALVEQAGIRRQSTPSKAKRFFDILSAKDSRE